VAIAFFAHRALECGGLTPLFTQGVGAKRRKRYTPRLKSNRYSSNRIIAPTIDMIQPAT
jgi:ribosomal protein S30